VAVVGSGPVGLFGAFYAGIRGLSVRIIDSLSTPGGQLTALYPEKYVYDMPGFPEVLAKDLAREMIEQASRFSPEYVLAAQAETLARVDDIWSVGTSRGEFPTRTVIICAGVGAFNPTKIGVEREQEFEGKGLTYGVKSKEELRGKRVAVIGGGDSALDWALGLEDIASEVVLIHRRDGFRAHEESIEHLQRSSVQIRLWEVVCEIVGDERVEAIITENKKSGERTRIDCDFVSVNIGFKSNLGPLLTWGLDLEKTKIKVNAHMETNLPGVYAAGDVCSHEAKLELIATGVGEVCTAVNFAKTFLDPSAKPFPGHSSDMDIPAIQK
jgi:thioredoxin reductase (NADPH)